MPIDSQSFSFSINDVVLVDWGSKLYYAKILTINHSKARCRLLFDDGSCESAQFSQIHHVNETTSDISCVVCKEGSTSPGNEIVLCDTCSIGFHQICHDPFIPPEALEYLAPWNCSYCRKGLSNPHIERNPFGVLKASKESIRNLEKIAEETAGKKISGTRQEIVGEQQTNGETTNGDQMKPVGNVVNGTRSERRQRTEVRNAEPGENRWRGLNFDRNQVTSCRDERDQTSKCVALDGGRNNSDESRFEGWRIRRRRDKSCYEGRGSTPPSTSCDDCMSAGGKNGNSERRNSRKGFGQKEVLGAKHQKGSLREKLAKRYMAKNFSFGYPKKCRSEKSFCNVNSNDKNMPRQVSRESESRSQKERPRNKRNHCTWKTEPKQTKENHIDESLDVHLQIEKNAKKDGDVIRMLEFEFSSDSNSCEEGERGRAKCEKISKSSERERPLWVEKLREVPTDVTKRPPDCKWKIPSPLAASELSEKSMLRDTKDMMKQKNSDALSFRTATSKPSLLQQGLEYDISNIVERSAFEFVNSCLRTRPGSLQEHRQMLNIDYKQSKDAYIENNTQCKHSDAAEMDKEAADVFSRAFEYPVSRKSSCESTDDESRCNSDSDKNFKGSERTDEKLRHTIEGGVTSEGKPGICGSSDGIIDDSKDMSGKTAGAVDSDHGSTVKEYTDDGRVKEGGISCKSHVAKMVDGPQCSDRKAKCHDTAITRDGKECFLNSRRNPEMLNQSQNVTEIQRLEERPLKAWTRKIPAQSLPLSDNSKLDITGNSGGDSPASSTTVNIKENSLVEKEIPFAIRNVDNRERAEKIVASDQTEVNKEFDCGSECTGGTFCTQNEPKIVKDEENPTKGVVSSEYNVAGCNDDFHLNYPEMSSVKNESKPTGKLAEIVDSKSDASGDMANRLVDNEKSGKQLEEEEEKLGKDRIKSTSDERSSSNNVSLDCPQFGTASAEKFQNIAEYSGRRPRGNVSNELIIDDCKSRKSMGICIADVFSLSTSEFHDNARMTGTENKRERYHSLRNIEVSPTKAGERMCDISCHRDGYRKVPGETLETVSDTLENKGAPGKPFEKFPDELVSLENAAPICDSLEDEAVESEIESKEGSSPDTCNSPERKSLKDRDNMNLDLEKAKTAKAQMCKDGSQAPVDKRRRRKKILQTVSSPSEQSGRLSLDLPRHNWLIERLLNEKKLETDDLEDERKAEDSQGSNGVGENGKRKRRHRKRRKDRKMDEDDGSEAKTRKLSKCHTESCEELKMDDNDSGESCESGLKDAVEEGIPDGTNGAESVSQNIPETNAKDTFVSSSDAVTQGTDNQKQICKSTMSCSLPTVEHVERASKGSEQELEKCNSSEACGTLSCNDLQGAGETRNRTLKPPGIAETGKEKEKTLNREVVQGSPMRHEKEEKQGLDIVAERGVQNEQKSRSVKTVESEFQDEFGKSTIEEDAMHRDENLEISRKSEKVEMQSPDKCSSNDQSFTTMTVNDERLDNNINRSEMFSSEDEGEAAGTSAIEEIAIAKSTTSGCREPSEACLKSESIADAQVESRKALNCQTLPEVHLNGNFHSAVTSAASDYSKREGDRHMTQRSSDLEIHRSDISIEAFKCKASLEKWPHKRHQPDVMNESTEDRSRRYQCRPSSPQRTENLGRSAWRSIKCFFHEGGTDSQMHDRKQPRDMLTNACHGRMMHPAPSDLVNHQADRDDGCKLIGVSTNSSLDEKADLMLRIMRDESISRTTKDKLLVYWRSIRKTTLQRDSEGPMCDKMNAKTTSDYNLCTHSSPRQASGDAVPESLHGKGQMESPHRDSAENSTTKTFDSLIRSLKEKQSQMTRESCKLACDSNVSRLETNVGLSESLTLCSRQSSLSSEISPKGSLCGVKRPLSDPTFHGDGEGGVKRILNKMHKDDSSLNPLVLQSRSHPITASVWSVDGGTKHRCLPSPRLYSSATSSPQLESGMQLNSHGFPSNDRHQKSFAVEAHQSAFRRSDQVSIAQSYQRRSAFSSYPWSYLQRPCLPKDRPLMMHLSSQQAPLTREEVLRKQDIEVTRRSIVMQRYGDSHSYIKPDSPLPHYREDDPRCLDRMKEIRMNSMGDYSRHRPMGSHPQEESMQRNARHRQRISPQPCPAQHQPRLQAQQKFQHVQHPAKLNRPERVQQQQLSDQRSLSCDHFEKHHFEDIKHLDVEELLRKQELDLRDAEGQGRSMEHRRQEHRQQQSYLEELQRRETQQRDLTSQQYDRYVEEKLHHSRLASESSNRQAQEREDTQLQPPWQQQRLKTQPFAPQPLLGRTRSEHTSSFQVTANRERHSKEGCVKTESNALVGERGLPPHFDAMRGNSRHFASPKMCQSGDTTHIPFCQGCGLQATSACSRCRKAWYCSRTCQVKEWKQHVKYCQKT